MKSVLEFISKYSSDNSIMPIIGLIAIITIIVIYIFVKPKWVKYIFSLLVIIAGGIFMYRGYKSMLDKSGLEMIINATKILTFGIIGLLFSAILDILNSFLRNFSKNKRAVLKKKLEEKKLDNSVLKDGKKEKIVDKTIVLDRKDMDKTIVIDKKDVDNTIN